MTDYVAKSNKIPVNKKKTLAATITSEIEYSQGTSLDPKTKDTATEAYVETDEVYITAEIYSLTDIPASLKKNKNAPPKPGAIVPEYCDEKCLVLRAYRDKTINTDEFFDFSEPCLSLKCIFPPDDFAEKLACLTKNEVRYCQPTSDGCVRINWSMCNPSCPNLIANQISQTEEDTIDLKASSGVIMELEEETKSDEEVEQKVGDGPEDPSDDAKGIQKEAGGLQEEDKREETERMEPESVKESATTGIQQTEEVEAELLEDGIIITPLKVDKKPGKPSAAKYDTGTIITNQTLLLEKPKRQLDCRRFSRESFCHSTRMSDSIVCCTRFVHPTTQHSMVQCNIIRGNATPSCITMDQPCDYLERRAPCARHFDNTRSEPKPSWSQSNEICSIDYWAKNDPNYGSFQETIARPHCATNSQRFTITREPFENCAQNRSNRNNAYQNYVNLNKGYYNSVRGYCFCNNVYNTRHANTFYCTPRNQMVYNTPANYYHCLNTWY
ncbi:uncharacterized protein LOC143264444 [Megachile rotundata]|uniref:uncharacterized protein LOC143264444 n=1 Tax=Megachile rotundata TaxID=143995 RepID=UPI003FD6954E